MREKCDRLCGKTQRPKRTAHLYWGAGSFFKFDFHSVSYFLTWHWSLGWGAPRRAEYLIFLLFIYEEHASAKLCFHTVPVQYLRKNFFFFPSSLFSLYFPSRLLQWSHRIASRNANRPIMDGALQSRQFPLSYRCESPTTHESQSLRFRAVPARPNRHSTFVFSLPYIVTSAPFSSSHSASCSIASS